MVGARRVGLRDKKGSADKQVRFRDLRRCGSSRRYDETHGCQRAEEKGLGIVIAPLVSIGESIDAGSKKLTPVQVAGIMLPVECPVVSGNDLRPALMTHRFSFLKLLQGFYSPGTMKCLLV